MEWLMGVLPIALVVLICPLMMIFMMRGMHGGQGIRRRDTTRQRMSGSLNSSNR